MAYLTDMVTHFDWKQTLEALKAKVININWLNGFLDKRP